MQYAARLKLERATDLPGDDDRRQEKANRGGQKQSEIGASAVNRLGCAFVRDEREGRQRQHFVKDKQREQVARQRDAHGRADRHGKTEEELRVMLFFVGAHIADGVKRGWNPQHGRDCRKQQS